MDMVAGEESGSEAESGWSGVSDNSSTWLLTAIQRHTMEKLSRQPSTSHGSWLSTWQLLLRGSCFFFSCIAERARGIVGQLSEISNRARQLLS